ncbi:MAG: TRAP transporter substrate-binding protein DctP [Deltaproteobacteria bacterium]|nr:TRAP transporter substrate-binding protein DctP [Deltaproteobacteria bacterium]
MKTLRVFLLIFMVGACLLTGYSTPVTAAGKPIVLKCVAFLPHHPGGRFQNAVDWCNRITEQSKGELTIKFMGGAETMPEYQQVVAVRKGIVDIAWTIPAFYQGIVRETYGFAVSEISPAEERANGFYDYINKIHMKKGLVYLGRNRGDGFYWSVNKLVKDPKKDFKGIKVGVIGTFWNSGAKELGMVPVNNPIPERYSAMQRGVVDGGGIAGFGAGALHLGEVTKYIIDHPIFLGGSSATIMNLKSWNNLPKHLQDLIMKEFINSENEMPEYFKMKVAEDRVALEKQGTKFIKFSPEDAEWYVKIIHEAKWAELKKAAPNAYDKIRGMLKKK